MRKDKDLYFVLLLTAIFCLWLAIKANAAEIGIAPDPYEKIWETATDEDIRLLECVVYYESARCECPDETNRAVIETVLNRCLSASFPSTISGVIRQSGQFYYKDTRIENKAVSEAIKGVQQEGRTVTPDYDYLFFATKKQSLGKDHVWVGELKTNGKPRKGKGMYFCRGK